MKMFKIVAAEWFDVDFVEADTPEEAIAIFLEFRNYEDIEDYLFNTSFKDVWAVETEEEE